MGNKFQDIRIKWMHEKGFKVLSDQYQLDYVLDLWDKDIDGVFCESQAGTGKTAIAVLAGIYGVLNGMYDRIIYIRNTEVVGKDIGFLTGDFEGKTSVHMKAFQDIMDKLEKGMYEEWVLKGLAVATTPTHLRGITFDRAFVILDECQNWSIEELQTVHTRITDASKSVTIGSLRQIDNQKLKYYYGHTPFEVFMMHFKNKNTSYIKLHKNYRGDWSLHADNVQETIKKLKESHVNKNE